MSLFTRLKKFLFYKNTSDVSKRISEINFWDVYNEANEQYNKNKSDQQIILMSKSEKVPKLPEEKKIIGDHKPIFFSEKNEKISKIKRYSLLTFFNFNERKYKNGARDSRDEFIYEDFKYFRAYP